MAGRVGVRRSWGGRAKRRRVRSQTVAVPWSRSLDAEGGDRVDRGGTEGWQVAGGQGGGHQDRGHGTEGPHVEGRDAVQA